MPPATLKPFLPSGKLYCDHVRSISDDDNESSSDVAIDVQNIINSCTMPNGQVEGNCFRVAVVPFHDL